jgi:hypothetical protein
VQRAGLARTPDAILLLPGIMGSQLVDATGRVVWGMRLGLLARQVLMRDALAHLALPPGGGDDGIRAGGLVELPVTLPWLTAIEPYTALRRRLARVALRPEAVRVHPYDWRHSIERSAATLVPVARAHLDAWRRTWATIPLEERRQLPEPQLTLVCHSMGGLVARWFAEVLGGGDVIRQIVTLGTPFAGSLNALRVLSDGDYLPFGLFAAALRDAARTMPGVYELIATYRCVGGAPDEPLRAIAVSDVAGIGADATLAQAAFAVHRRLAAAVAAAGEGRTTIHPLVGVQQPTAQSARFVRGAVALEEQLDGTDHRGDGTVYRYAAAPRGRQPMPLPQAHGALAKAEEAITFVETRVTEQELGEVQAPPGFGMRVPPAVRAGVAFDVAVLDGAPGTTCRVTDAETNVQVAVAAVQRRADGLAATVTVPAPGVYRVSVAGGGYSPVEDLVLAFADGE